MPRNKKTILRRGQRNPGFTSRGGGGSLFPGESTRLDARSTVTALTRTVFPPRLRRTLRYVDNVPMSSVTGGVVLQQFRCNGIFDPDYTGTGHQPRYFDQLCSAAGPYSSYRVLKHAVKATMCIIAGSEDAVLWAGGYSDTAALPGAPSGSVFSNITGYAELPGWLTGFIPPAGAPAVVAEWSTDIGAINSVPMSTILAADSYTASYNNVPSDVLYWNFQIQCTHGASADTSITFEHVFEVQFEDPVPVGPS